MDIGKIDGCNATLGAPAGWDADRDGPCEGLPVRREHMPGGTPVVTSMWQPSLEEMEAIKAGAPIMLRVVGYTHPPVAVYVGEVPPLRAGR